VDQLSKTERSALMRRIKSKDTVPEVLVRKLIFSMGYRYRLHTGKLQGNPDIVFQSLHKIIFINGCFWHQHKGCKGSHIPKSNIDYWQPKLGKTVKRDLANRRKLIKDGWDVLVIWECEINNIAKLKKMITMFLN
jgi:DNA mismatch endonuclease, patch repair protein